MDFASAVEHSSQMRAKASAIERALAQAPLDKGLRLTLLSAQRRAERAEAQLLELAETAQVDLCRYKVQRPTDNQYPAEHFAQSLVYYQHLFTALYDYAKSRVPRATANYPRGVRDRTLLNLAYTFPGSMGVLLSVPAARDLFGEGELDIVVRALQRVTAVESQHDVKWIAQEMGLNVIRKTGEWARHNWNAEYSVDIQWRNSADIRVGSFIERDHFLRISSLINQTSDEVVRDIELTGTLVGYHDLSERFSFATPDGEIYNGRFHDDFQRREYRIPAQYVAKMRERTTTKYASDTVDRSYLLLSLD